MGRGFIEFIVSDDPAAVALRKNTIVYFVPLMDVDNVSIGAGGKNQDPHDHNRDWIDKPVFPAVTAAQKIIRDLDAAGGFDAFIDLHNPAAGDLKPFFFVSEGAELRDKGKENLAKFVATATKHITGPMALNTKTRASGASYDKNWKAISKNWVNANTKDGTVAVTLETSWNTPHSNIEGYTTVGRQLAAAVAEYLGGGRDQRP